MPDPDDDLWFLPAPFDGEEVGMAPERAKAQTVLFDTRVWREAQASLAADLAALMQDAGRFEERLAEMGEGVRQRIALQEAVALGWWTGDRISADKLALWQVLHLAGAGDDAQALSRSNWAARRLAAPVQRGEGLARLAAELALPPDTWPDRLQDVAEVLARSDDLHPVVQGCMAFHIWRMSGEEPQRLTEASVIGERVAGGRIGFLPLALAGLGALTVTGGEERRLAGWIASAHQAVLSALLQMDRLRRWRSKASEATADLSGRTPALLIDALIRLPMVSAPVAEKETGASRAAVQRNLDRLAERDLVREITGQGRFRVWTAKV